MSVDEKKTGCAVRRVVQSLPFILIKYVFWVFLGMNTLTRIGLMIFNKERLPFDRVLLILGLGSIYDMAVGLWWCMPIVLWLLFVSWQMPLRKTATIMLGNFLVVMVGALCFVSASEFVFWNEFSSRFNFIAVDYLIYTREVLGNIRESYNLLPVFSAIIAVTLMVVGILFFFLKRDAQKACVVSGTKTQRFVGFLAYVCLASVTTAFVKTEWKDNFTQPQQAQLAGNGIWEFFYAYRFNQIDFQRFYATLPHPLATHLVQQSFSNEQLYRWQPTQTKPIEHQVLAQGKELRRNVVLVSIESFGAEYIGSLGGQTGITPAFEQLAQEGLFFTKMYATGTRTVRGLEALTLSVPPTPGHAIPMRPHNQGLFTLGGVFKSKGYDALYLYGGYSYFDNMNAFFGGNGYTVIDRTAIAAKDISHETIWGVADEDLFKLALKQMDERLAIPDAKPVFMHVMTTSNHRPFTYPNGRIDIPSGTGREGAVKYTDYAIGQFVEAAKKKPWFNNTLFIFVADHTSIGRGQTALSMERYHIPMVVYAPGLISPRRITTRASHIDVAPTILGQLNWSYPSQFFGRDILKDGASDHPIFMANYQTIGFVDQDQLVELRPKKGVKVFTAANGQPLDAKAYPELINKAIAFYQVAAEMYR